MKLHLLDTAGGNVNVTAPLTVTFKYHTTQDCSAMHLSDGVRDDRFYVWHLEKNKSSQDEEGGKKDLKL